MVAVTVVDDVDALVRDSRELRERLAAVAAKLDIFTEQLQANVDRLRTISTEMSEASDGAEGAGRERS